MSKHTFRSQELRFKRQIKRIENDYIRGLILLVTPSFTAFSGFHQTCCFVVGLSCESRDPDLSVFCRCCIDHSSYKTNI